MPIFAILAALVFASVGSMLTPELSGILWGAVLGYLIVDVIFLRIKLNQLAAKRLKPSEVLPVKPESFLPKAHPPTTQTAMPSLPLDLMARHIAVAPATVTAEVTKLPNKKPSLVATQFLAAIHKIKHFFTSGNIVAKVGIIILFFGMAFFVKYAAQRNYFPAELRLLVSVIAAFILFFIGWRIRFKKQEYALILQGGGLGIIYLTVYLAYRLYHLIPSTLTFFLLFLFVLFGAMLAILQNSRVMAIVAVVGGFLAPLLASSGSGNYIALFSYYLVLNLGIFFMTWFKPWRELTFIGFVFTFVIASLWGFYSYKPDFYVTNQVFLALFFILYAFIPVVEALRHQGNFKKLVDASLVFGVPLLAYALQIGLVHHLTYGAAFSSLALALFYGLLTTWVWKYPGDNMLLLKECYRGLAILFATVTIPLAFNGEWASTVWALEGACIVWLGVRQHHLVGRCAGILLQIGAGCLFTIDFPGFAPLYAGFFNSTFLGCLTLALAGIFSSYQLRVKLSVKQPFDNLAGILLLIIGLFWWSLANVSQLAKYFYPLVDMSVYWQWLLGTQRITFYNSLLLFFTMSSFLAWRLKEKLTWRDLQKVAILLPMEMLFCILIMCINAPNAYTLIPWIISFITAYWILWRHQLTPASYLPYLHAMMLIIILLELTLQLHQGVSTYLTQGYAWQLISYALLPMLYLLLLPHPRILQLWPVNLYTKTYAGSCAVVIVVYLVGWLWTSFSSTGDAYPIAYLPLLNPVDMVDALILCVIYAWIKHPVVTRLFHLTAENFQVILSGFAVLTFISLNVFLLRALHHYAGIPYSWHYLFNSQLVQMSVSIFWTVLALVITTLGSKRQIRQLWFIGGTLILIVVLKLLVIDLENTGTLERIIAFIVVGLLLLLIGYAAPIPAKKIKSRSDHEKFK